MAAGEDLTGVADPEADHVSDPVREEHRHRPGLEQRLGLAAQESEIDQTLRDDEGRGAVHVAELGRRDAALRGGLPRPADEGVQLGLRGRERAAHRIGAGDVAGVAPALAARVDEHELARPNARDEGAKWSTAEFVPLPTIVS